MENLIWVIWFIIQFSIGFHLVFPIILFVFYTLFGNNKHHKGVKKESNREADYAIIVTAYEQTHSIGAVVESILSMDYQNYMVYIVADKCDVSNLKFEDRRVVVLRPPEVLSSNTKSHFYAINRFVRPHERLTIIDSDNLVDPGYLQSLNYYFEKGFSAVQGERKAKNLDTTFSCLDAARDIYYHFYDGKLLFSLGSSATLAGSGMAFTTELYKDCLEQLDISGAGFDKVLQNEIVTRKLRIAFEENAIVYDEKTSKPEQLVKQRARWINTWFKYFGFGFGLLIKGFAEFNWNQFLFGIVLLRPPLFIFLILSLAMLSVNLILSPIIALVWALSFLLFILGFMLALWSYPTDKKIYNALSGIPSFVFIQIQSLLKARRANQISVATQHFHQNTVEDFKEK